MTRGNTANGNGSGEDAPHRDEVGVKVGTESATQNTPHQTGSNCGRVPKRRFLIIDDISGDIVE